MGIVDAVNPQRTLTMQPAAWGAGFKCMEEKGGLYAEKAADSGNIIEPNLGAAVTNKTLAILLKHDQTKGDITAREIRQQNAFMLNRWLSFTKLCFCLIYVYTL